MRAFSGTARQHELTPLVAEYVERKRLASMGLTSNLSDLPCDHVDKLLVIDQKWTELTNKRRQAEQDKAAKSGRRGRKRGR